MSADLIWAIVIISYALSDTRGINMGHLPSCLCVSDLSLAMMSIRMNYSGLSVVNIGC